MSHVARTVRTGSALGLLLAALWLLWPISLGGGTTYVATHGISMQPRFHTGDLAVLRPAATYEVGDVIAYRSATLHTTVMHRVVARDGDRFVTRGDNNSWQDPDHPTPTDVLGRLWLRVPHGGTALGQLTSPAVLGGIGIAVTSVVASIRTQPSRRRRRRHRQGRPEGARPVGRPLRTRPTPADTDARGERAAFSVTTRARSRQTAVAAAAVAVLAAVGGGVLLLLPATQSETRSAQVTERGQYSYAGTAVQGTTYPSGRIVTGDPVYTRLLRNLTVTLDDVVQGDDLSGVGGDLHLDVSLASPDGWSAPLGAGAPAPLLGGKASAAVALDPLAAAGVLARHYAEVGQSAGDVKLVVTPVLRMTGTVAGRPVALKPLPPLSFTLGSTALRLADAGDAALAPSVTTTATVQAQVPRRLPVLSASIPLGLARALSAVVLVVGLAVAAVAGWIGRSRRRDPADEFLVRHADRILDVAAFTPGSTVIDVSDPEALSRVAGRLDGILLHHTGPEGHTLAVRDNETTYRHVIPYPPALDPVARLTAPVPVLHRRPA
jgi:signal peptidase I